ELINHSPDIKQLVDEGYELEAINGYLFVHHVPYLNSKREVSFGTLVSELNLQGASTTTKPRNHVVMFIGEQPYNVDGNEITSIKHTVGNKVLFDNREINRTFSNKP